VQEMRGVKAKLLVGFQLSQQSIGIQLKKTTGFWDHKPKPIHIHYH